MKKPILAILCSAALLSTMPCFGSVMINTQCFLGAGNSLWGECTPNLYSTSEIDQKLSAIQQEITQQGIQTSTFENTLAQQLSAVQNQVNTEDLRAMIRQIVQEELQKQTQK